jgi:hypothetical protein
MYDSSMSMLSRPGGDSRMRNLNVLGSRYICPTSAVGAERDRRMYNALSDTRIGSGRNYAPMEWSSEESVSPCLGLPSFICLPMLRIRKIGEDSRYSGLCWCGAEITEAFCMKCSMAESNVRRREGLGMTRREVGSNNGDRLAESTC